MEEREQKSENVRRRRKVESERVLSTGEVSLGGPGPRNRGRPTDDASLRIRRLQEKDTKAKKAMICSDCFSSSGRDSSPPLWEVYV